MVCVDRKNNDQLAYVVHVPCDSGPCPPTREDRFSNQLVWAMLADVITLFPTV